MLARSGAVAVVAVGRSAARAPLPHASRLPAARSAGAAPASVAANAAASLLVGASMIAAVPAAHQLRFASMLASSSSCSTAWASAPLIAPVSASLWAPAASAAAAASAAPARSLHIGTRSSFLLADPRTPSSAPARSPKKGNEDKDKDEGAGGLFEVEPDAPPPSTRLGKAQWRARLTGRYIVFAGLVTAMTASAALMLEFYFFNPEAEVRERTTRLLQTQPHAMQLLGANFRDVTLQHAGSRGLQAHHHFPFFGKHVVSCSYVLQGARGRAQVHVEWNKDGDQWSLRYLRMDSGKFGSHVLQDRRDMDK